MNTETKIDELLVRSASQVFPSREIVKGAMLSGKKLKIYVGADATGPDLHLGHATNFMLLERFRQLGHEVIVLFGDFTAMIGDPTDKATARKQLTEEQVQENLKTWKSQAEKIIDFSDPENPAKIMRNSEWLSELNFADMVRLGSSFTVQQMLKRDMFRERMIDPRFDTFVLCKHCGNPLPSPIQIPNPNDPNNIGRVKVENVMAVSNCQNCGNLSTYSEKDFVYPQPIYIHEFFYPLMQGYDSVAMDVDMEIGGTDQMFNMLAGRVLQKKYNNKEKFVITTTLLEHPETKKKLMSKSEGNYIALNDSPNDMFGKTMALPDGIIRQMLTDCTYLPMADVEEIMKAENPRDAKVRLAKEIVALYHGAEEAAKAEEYFVNTFSKGEIPEDISDAKAEEGMKLVELIVSLGFAESKSEARRKIEQGGVELGGERMTDGNATLSVDHTGKVLKVGKKDFVRILL